MTNSETAIAAIVKDRSGKGAARELRRKGYIPAVIYHVGQNSEAIAISASDLGRALRAGHFYTTTQELDIGGKKTKVLAREIQRHPVTDTPLHVDFIRYNPKQKIHVNVTVRLVGEESCPGIKMGGVLQLTETSVEVVCRADSIPEELVADVSALELGESIHLSNITLPEGVEPAITDRDLTIASIISTRTSTMNELDAEAEAQAAAAAGGEDEAKAEAGKEGEKKED